MNFNYEQSIWGRGTATLNVSDPSCFRLKQCLKSFLNLPANGRILEVGCGAGQFIGAIKKNMLQADCRGCDISQQAIEQAKQRNDGVIYELMNNENSLPYDSDSFDGVAIFDVLEHAVNPENLLKEIYRILRPHGVFYMFVPCEGDNLSFWHWLDKLGLKNNLTKKFAGHINYFSRGDIVRLLQKNGFDISRCRYSEHIVGQKLGVFSFFMMNRAAKKQNGGQINNEEYFAKFNGSGVSLFKKFVNAWINLESCLWQKIPSPNLHITSIKK
ncbi:MAG: hypothetical protein COU29_03295 [Candidatus Magasanikbacteria bacterium CG10_big_fil_rev_8_21_14_0_10_36_32]|uniref:Methyltransferase type 11 domain-containing protein n=1 Tax=Candidatus Magasanikbacteria bacterium CG10_big_fil_rev_8_21_14_0_10_36_32 TaxID=1974646 RepID=A0A2M6W656_9BACT|nr:MAG: hypothetical protein COU29_03295 [Candidatus Magasanikbacteria bacterium CG10_big_fil_rev_8_21_14_0_10_36_32]